MRWYEGLYVGEGLAGKADTIRRNIEDGECPRFVYIITPALNGSDLLDIRHGRDLEKPFLQSKDLLIVGIALGADEAAEVTAKIVAEHLHGGKLCLEGDQ